MRMPLTFRTAACTAAVLLATAGVPAYAQDAQPAPAAPAAPAPAAPAEAATPAPAPEPAADPAAVVATVGEETITEGEVEIARDEFASELAQVPPEQQRSVLIDALVNMKVLAMAAREAGLDQGPEFTARLDFLRFQALRNAYVENRIINSLTPEEIQQGYQTMVLGQFKPEEQVRARHILVGTKEEAEKIIADLKGGANFEELAKQSKDPSGQNGGDLGFFGKGQMVPPFEQAAFALEPGALTETPVESQFGWHVIRVEEKRMSEPPALTEVEGELRQYLLRQKFETAMTELRNKYPVEIVGQPAPADAPAAAPAPAQGEAAPAAPAGTTDQPAAGEAPAN